MELNKRIASIPAIGCVIFTLWSLMYFLTNDEKTVTGLFSVKYHFVGSYSGLSLLVIIAIAFWVVTFRIYNR